MKKLKRKVATHRDFTRIASLIAPGILIAGPAAAFDPTEEISTGARAPRKRRRHAREQPKRVPGASRIRLQ